MRGLVDGAAAFAGLYQRWFDDARGLSRENRQTMLPLIGSFIADILAVRDDRTGAWLPEAPVLVRFETSDVVAFPMRAPYLALFRGSVDTDSPAATFGPGLCEQPMRADAASCRWMTFRPCSFAIGRQLVDVDFETSGGLLTALTLHIDDGGLLRIDSRGIGCALEPTPLSA